MEKDISSSASGAIPSHTIKSEANGKKAHRRGKRDRSGGKSYEETLEAATVIPSVKAPHSEIMMIAIVLIILTLFMITVALFKMTSSILLLSARLDHIEEILETNGEFFRKLVQQPLPGEEMNE